MKELLRTFGYKQTIISYSFLILGAASIFFSMKSFFSGQNPLAIYKVERFQTIYYLLGNYWFLVSIFTIFLIGGIVKGYIFKPTIVSYTPIEIHFIKPSLIHPNELFLAKLIKKMIKNILYTSVIFLIFVNPFLDYLEFSISMQLLLFGSIILLILLFMLLELLSFFLKAEIIYSIDSKHWPLLILVLTFVFAFVSVFVINPIFLPSTLFVNLFYMSIFGNLFITSLISAIVYLIVYFVIIFISILILSHHYYLFIEQYDDHYLPSILFLFKNKFPKPPRFFSRQFFSMFYKDLLVNLRTTYVQILILSFLVFFILFFVQSLISPLMFSLSPVLKVPFGLFSFVLVIFLLSPITIYSFSEELMYAWVIKTAPIDFKKVLDAKYVLFFILTLLSTSPIFILLALFMNDPVVQIAFIFEIFFEGILYVILGIYISILYSPQLFEKEFPLSGFIAYATQFIIIGAPVLFILVLTSFHIIGLFVGIIISGVYTWMTYRYYVSLSLYKFYERETE